MTPLIGFSGYARSGKDTAVSLLPHTRVAFADVMREFAERLNPIVGEGSPPPRLKHIISQYGWDGYKSSPYSTEIRGLLQRLGTECGRQLIGDDVWVNAALDNLPPGLYAISDCRFLNEAEAIRKRGGKVIRIERPGVGPANSHPSETSLDDYDFDHVIVNDGSLKDFQKRLYEVL